MPERVRHGAFAMRPQRGGPGLRLLRIRIGFKGRFDYAAIGGVTNLASRLCDEAKDNQILIDGKVCAAVEEIAELEPLQDLKLKGFHRPIKAANVTSISGQEDRNIPNL
jgi:class 3 adenylate cyclase